MNSKFKKYTWFILIWTFLVIAAGGIVRMTQSGMGCPDWPTCFGRWIPPVNESQLPSDFEKYLSKQDIDHSFNVYHTWIEYVNRLLGAVLGLFIFIHLIWSFRISRKINDWKIFLFSFLMFISVGIQGWLGKLVVDANLSVFKITVHMIGALVLCIFPLLILNYKRPKISVPKSIYFTLVGLIVLLLIQIVLGTQVREAVDEISKEYMYQHRELWIERLGNEFLIHRSFSWLLLLVSIYLAFKSSKFPLVKKYGISQLAIVLFTICLGVIMNYLNMPAIAQPLHLISGSLLFCYLVYYLLRVNF